MRTRMMAFYLIAFCVMPIEAKKVKGEWGYYHERNLRQRLFSDKSRLNRHGYSDSWFSLFSRVGEIRRTFSIYARRISVIRITIDEKLTIHI